MEIEVTLENTREQACVTNFQRTVLVTREKDLNKFLY